MRIIERAGSKNQPGLVKALEACLRWIPESDLRELNHVELVPNVDLLKTEPCWWRSLNDRDPVWAKAMYSRRSNQGPAYITVFTDALSLPIERIIRFRPVTTLYFARIVAHEVGHHLIATRGFACDPTESSEAIDEEEHCDRYAFEIVRRMKSTWYYRFAARTLAFFSKVHFEEGRQNWLREDFTVAAASWYKAWLLDPENTKAGELFLLARERSKRE